MSEHAQRRLAAILAADVVGYSRMIRSDEDGTLAALKALRVELIAPKLAEHNGRIVKLMGDGMLVEFSSVVDAVRAAVETQKAVADRNAGLPEGKRIVFRVGINLGDVVIDGDDIQGDGVNVAARLEGLADPGGICISGAVHDQVKNRMPFTFEDLGEREVKNINEPVRVWRWHRHAAAEPPSLLSAQTATPPPDKPSIAVLPFTNMSQDPEQEYFADGITEDIITDLSKVSGLLVIARNSSFAYKNQSPDVRRVCHDLGVRHVLEGSVRRAGGRVRINAQLIDGSSGGHLWAERYDRSLEDIFAVQDEVTREIVDALKIALTINEQTRLEGRGKVNPEAYDCLIRGRICVLQFTPEAMVESRALLERAIDLDSTLLAPAHAMLSVVHSLEYVNGWNDAGPEHLSVALELAQKALAADEHEPHAYYALALAPDVAAKSPGSGSRGRASH
jgi:adenylate cyclase